MLNDCNTSNPPSYDQVCCLKHLIMLSNYLANQTLGANYASNLFKALNKAFKNNSIQFKTLSLSLFNAFLEMVGKYAAHFYFTSTFSLILDKIEYAKLLIKLALQGCGQVSFKDHQSVTLRKIAIFCNLSSLYHRY